MICRVMVEASTTTETHEFLVWWVNERATGTFPVRAADADAARRVVEEFGVTVPKVMRRVVIDQADARR